MHGEKAREEETGAAGAENARVTPMMEQYI